MKVSLRDVVGEVDLVYEGSRGFLNIKTGECYRIPAEDLEEELEDDLEEDAEEGLDEDSEEDEEPEPEKVAKDEAKLPQWEREALAKNREVLGSEDWIELPSKDDFEEYPVMEAFCETVADERFRERLEDAIHGAGAFRRFKDGVHRFGLQDQWYQFREEALTTFVAEWLDFKGIAYEAREK